ncbi:hypothetical protein HYX11_03845 [Candidatus Woesearchaeota archaeon]|nr:hypothetical protein [Candidatus Woesearchaeota archaeon]
MVDKTKKRWLLITILLIILISLTIFLTRPKSEVKELKMDLIIGNHTGINLDADALHFGTIKKGEVKTLTREVIVNNNYTYPKKVRLSIKGDLSEIIKISENNFILLQGENKTISITAIVNPERDYGTYEWVLRAVFQEMRDGES